MKKILATADFGFCGAEYEETFEFEDDATEDEIWEEIWRWACENVNINYEEIEEE